VYTYFEIGRIIVEEEQEGEFRAEYGKNLIRKDHSNSTDTVWRIKVYTL
jgi:hypothetical protein